jgi:branched-chain amino acid aminotransferase
MAKSAANYMNSQLIKMEAIKAGLREGIALDAEGYLSEGSGENLFVVKKGTLYTPPAGLFPPSGNTRDS